MHLRHRRRLLRAVTAVVAVASIATLIAVLDPFAAGAEHARHARHPRPGHGHVRAFARAAATEDAAIAVTSHFELLRQTPTPLPADVLANISRAPEDFGLVASMGRQATDGTWVIPGADSTCMAITDDEGIGMNCVSNAAAEAGELHFTIRGQAAGEEQIRGVLPDDRSSVTAFADDGTILATANATDNTYELSVRNAARFKVE